LKTVVNCNVASASVSLHTFSFMALYKFVFNLTLTSADNKMLVNLGRHYKIPCKNCDAYSIY